MSKNTLYKFMQFAFWMTYCGCYGFVSYYLVDMGFSTAVVGVVSAIAGIASAIGQVVVGNLSDNPQIGWKKPLVVISFAITIFGALMLIVSSMTKGMLICVIYGIVMLLLGVATPLLNTAAVAFPNEINFGTARGLASFGYAATSYALGYFTAWWGNIIIPISVTVMSVFFIVTSIKMPYVAKEAGEASKKEKEISAFGFLSKYPKFTLLWIGCILILTVHCMSNSFLLQILEKAGGDSHNLGIAVAIACIMEVPMIFFYEKITKFIKPQHLFVISAATYLLRSVIQLFTSNLLVLYMVQLLQFTSWGVYASASVYYTNEIIPKKDQGKGQAYMANALTVGTVVGSLLGGQIIAKLNVNVMLFWQNIVAALGFVIMVIWIIRFNERKEPKTIIFLGSSITYGYAAGGISFADIVCEQNGYKMVKEAVSGTTLVDKDKESYISRMKEIDAANADLFICQLSTNDANLKLPLGEIIDSTKLEDFDTNTVTGAIEYIIAFAKNEWNCPIAFYTNPPYENEEYKRMVERLIELSTKWDICIFDMYNDSAFNEITKEERDGFMADAIHPNESGYKVWWTPYFDKKIKEIIKK